MSIVIPSVPQLRKIFPKAKQDYLEVIASSKDLFEKYGLLNNQLRINHFISQCGWESDGYMNTIEQGPDSYFKRYDNRKDLGNIEPGDGLRFKGRGFIQLTGRSNYKWIGGLVGEDFTKQPELVATPKYALLVSVVWWTKMGLNQLADYDDIRKVTRKINGGYNGLEGRIKYYKALTSVLKSENL